MPRLMCSSANQGDICLLGLDIPAKGEQNVTLMNLIYAFDTKSRKEEPCG